MGNNQTNAEAVGYNPNEDSIEVDIEGTSIEMSADEFMYLKMCGRI